MTFSFDDLSIDEKLALLVKLCSSCYNTLKDALTTIYEKIIREQSLSKSYYYKLYYRGIDSLQRKGLLDENKNLTEVAYNIIPSYIYKRIIQEISQRIKGLNDEIDRLTHELYQLSELMDFTATYGILKPWLSHKICKDIEKAIRLYKLKEYGASITEAYKITELLLKRLFKKIYGDKEFQKVKKHENKLKRLWTDEHLEKHKYPGVNLIASLFATVLWYRNKMGAHAEMEPTREAARVTLISLLQSVIEIKRLGFEDILRQI